MKALAAIFGRTLVVAPHADDEVLGAGGTIARLSAAGGEVHVAVVTSGRPPRFSIELRNRVRKEAELAHAKLGVKDTVWLDLPAAQLTETPTADLNAALDKVMMDVAPTTLLLPFIGDMHVDHQLVFRSAMVAARPHSANYPERILAYETVSETNWNAPYLGPSFVPNMFVCIDDHLSLKIEAMRLYQSQLREPPHERSVESLRALATVRGATIHRAAAEAFVWIRCVT